MYFKTCLLFIVITCAFFQATTGFSVRESPDKNDDSASAANNASETDSLDDRLNLNFNLAQAQGFGRFGAHSQSNSLSYGVKAGIRGPNGQYQNLLSRTGSQSHGYSTGPGAPLTFAQTGSHVRPGHAGGNAAAGVYGGRGSSFATSQNHNIEIPLDGRGTVLLSNLQAPSNSSAQSSEATDDNNSESKENAPLVFA